MEDSFKNKTTKIDDVLDKNLTIPKEDVNKGDFPYWEASTVRDRISRIQNRKHKMLLQFMWMTGCRISEAINVKRADIDFTNYTVLVKWQKSNKGNHRNIPLHPRLQEILGFYCADFNRQDYIFNITRQRAFQICKKHLDGHPHKLRHSFAVHWLRSGNRLETLSQILGHSDIKTTMVYLQIVPRDQGKELMNMEF